MILSRNRIAYDYHHAGYEMKLTQIEGKNVLIQLNLILTIILHKTGTFDKGKMSQSDD